MKNSQNVSDTSALSGESVAGRRSSASGAGIEIVIDEEDVGGGIGGSTASESINNNNGVTEKPLQKWTNIDLGNPGFITVCFVFTFDFIKTLCHFFY